MKDGVKRYNPHSEIDVSAWIVEAPGGTVVLAADHDRTVAELTARAEAAEREMSPEDCDRMERAAEHVERANELCRIAESQLTAVRTANAAMRAQLSEAREVLMDATSTVRSEYVRAFLERTKASQSDRGTEQ